MPYTQNHARLEPLQKIDRHDQLPDQAILLFESEFDESGLVTYSAISHENHLKVLTSYTLVLKSGPQYYCHQYDFPLKALSWFPKTLEAFMNGVMLEGGGGGGMTTPEIEVNGEFLSVSRHSSGYDLNNWSRQCHQAFDDEFRPTMLSFESDFLFDAGFLQTWTRFGDKFEKGLLGP